MGFSMWTLVKVALLVVNAMAVLNEKKLLSKFGLHKPSAEEQLQTIEFNQPQWKKQIAGLLFAVRYMQAAAAAAAPGGESAGEETDVCESCDNSERLWEMPPHLAAAEGTRCLAQASSLQHPTDRPVLSCALFCSAIIRCYEGVFGVCIDSELVELACCVPTALWHGTSVCAALQNYTVIVWAAILYARGSEAALLEIADGGMTHCSVGLPSQLGFRAAVWPCANS